MRDFVRISGTDRRFEANFNALGAALSLLGMDTVDGLVDISKLRPSTFPALFSCCLNEGARLEGDDWRISPEDTGALPIARIQEMLAVFVRQSSPDAEVEEKKKETVTGGK